MATTALERQSPIDREESALTNDPFRLRLVVQALLEHDTDEVPRGVVHDRVGASDPIPLSPGQTSTRSRQHQRGRNYQVLLRLEKLGTIERHDQHLLIVDRAVLDRLAEWLSLEHPTTTPEHREEPT